MAVIDQSQYLNGVNKVYPLIGTLIAQSFRNVPISSVGAIVQGFKEHYNPYFIAQNQLAAATPFVPNFSIYHDNGGADEPFIYFDWNYPPPSTLPVDVEGNVWDFGDNYPNPISLSGEPDGHRVFSISVNGEFHPDGYPDNLVGFLSWSLSLVGVQKVDTGVPVDFYDFDLVFSSTSKYEIGF